MAPGNPKVSQMGAGVPGGNGAKTSEVNGVPAAAVDLTGSIGHGPVWRSTTNDNWEGRGLPEVSSSGVHGACGRRGESRVGRPLTSCLRASRHTWKETPVTSGGAGSQSGRPGSAHMQMPGNPTDASIPTPSIGRAAAGHGPSPDTRRHEGGALALRLAAMPRSIPPRPARSRPRSIPRQAEMPIRDH